MNTPMKTVGTPKWIDASAIILVSILAIGLWCLLGLALYSFINATRTGHPLNWDSMIASLLMVWLTTFMTYIAIYGFSKTFSKKTEVWDRRLAWALRVMAGLIVLFVAIQICITVFVPDSSWSFTHDRMWILLVALLLQSLFRRKAK